MYKFWLFGNGGNAGNYWRLYLMKNKVKVVSDMVAKVLSVTNDSIDEMALGDRVQMKDLVEKVSLVTGFAAKDVSVFVDYFVHNTDNAYVARGKNGGVTKGVKPVSSVKTVKPAKVVEVPPSASDEESDVDSNDSEDHSSDEE